MSIEPGFSTRARVYLWLVIVAGLGAIAESLYQLVAYPIGFKWFILAALTLVTGSATVRLPSVAATISVSEAFVFISVLLYGPPAGTLTVALDALVITFWQKSRRRNIQRVLFNVAATSFSCWVGAKLFFAIWGGLPLVLQKAVDIPSLLPALLVFSLVYFALNSWLITFAITLETTQPALRIWRQNFALLALNYFGGASVAAILVSYTPELDYRYLVIVIPPLLILYVTFVTSMGRVEDANRHLSELNSLYMSTIETLAMAIDAKDQITHGHIRRVQLFAIGLAKNLGIKEESQIKAIEAAALLHDMGKLAVPEYILNKPGPLTPAEFEKMKLHATVGADILSSIAFPYPVVPIVRHHHENWDGTGYPDGLKGTDIPLGARILSIVDCFDALTSDRPYRPRLADSEAIKILLERRGRMYDPLIVDTFITVHAEIETPAETAEPHGHGLVAITEAAGPVALDSATNRFEDISSSTEEMLTLYELARGLTGQMQLPDVADVISKHLRRIVPALVSVFFVYKSEDDELVVAHASGDSTGVFAGLRIPLGHRITGWVAANRQTILNSDPVLDLGDVARSSRPRLRSCLSTPLVLDGKLVGVLSLYSTARDAFSEDHRRIAEAVAKQVAGTIKSAAELEQRESYLRDDLTGLPTIDKLKQLSVAEREKGGQAAENLSILFLDIGGLKAVQQELGRSVGDEVLSRIIDRARRTLRGADLLFRFGSNEFVALLAETDARTAASIAQEISSAVAEIPFAREVTKTSISVNIGIATSPSDGRSLEQLVGVARSRSADDSGETSDSVH